MLARGVTGFYALHHGYTNNAVRTCDVGDSCSRGGCGAQLAVL